MANVEKNYWTRISMYFFFVDESIWKNDMVCNITYVTRDGWMDGCVFFCDGCPFQQYFSHIRTMDG